jgi:hypothetical protein
MSCMLPKQTSVIRVRRQFSVDSGLQHRRGVLLLIVVSMLTLFLMLGTAYIVTASRARESARALSRKTLFADQLNYRPETYLDEVLMRVVRGGPIVGLPTPIGSGLAPSFESLLEDRYGPVFLSGSVDSPAIYSGAGAGNTGPVITVDFAPVVGGPTPHPAELNGLVLTLTADGKPSTSHRIVRAYAAGSGYSLALTNPRSPHQWTGTTISDFSGNAIINGREFSGAGPPNEAWDGFDSDNPFLAQVEPGSTASRTTVVRPSFFGATDWSDLSADIDGDGLPDNDPFQDLDGIDCDTDGILDSVDNDGDGVSDGVFLEWGFAPLPAAAGDVRLHASALIVDLDGRFNVNAHGSLANMPLRDGTLTNPAESIYSSSNPDWPQNAGVDRSAIVTEFQSVPLGAGVGPADVNPNHLFSTLALDAATPSSSTTAGLDEQVGGFVTTGGRSGDALGTRPSAGRFTSGVNTPRVGSVEGRYGGSGADLDTLAASPPASIASASKNGVSIPGGNIAAREVSDNILAALGVPDNWWGGTTDSYSSPPDLLGRMKTLTRAPLDETGSASDEDGDGRVTRGLVPRPTYAKAEWPSEQAYSPYSTRLTSIGTRGGSLHSPSTDGTTSASVVTENPFTLGELESLLRPYDADSTKLPVRLTAMLGTVAEQMRTRLTTESWDTTCVVDGATGGAWDRLATSLAILPTGAGLYNSSPVLGAIGGEISRGEKFNLNRPLTNTKPSSYNHADDYYVQRQAFFKDLYTLLVLLNPGASLSDKETFAQWAANVVEFRDADSTMTPFEYDTNLANGWAPDGNVTTPDADRGDTIWGVERPEVLITSGVGWEDSGGNGEIYIGLHRPWNSDALWAGASPSPGCAADADFDTTGSDLVDLAKTPAGGTYPIWRFRLESGSSSVEIPIQVPHPDDMTALGASAWDSSNLKLDADEWLGVRLSTSVIPRNLSFAPVLLRDHDVPNFPTPGPSPDRELELFRAVMVPTGSPLPSPPPATLSFPGSIKAPGVDRTITVHLERLDCPSHSGDANWGMAASDGYSGTSLADLTNARYVSIDSIDVVLVNRDPYPVGPPAVVPTFADVANVENTRRVASPANQELWLRAANPYPVGGVSTGSPATYRSSALPPPGSGAASPLGNLTPPSPSSISAYPWLNRPFNSSVELFLVPDDSPQDLLLNYRTLLTGPTVHDVPSSGLLFDALTVPTWFAGVHDSWVDGSDVLRGETGIDDRCYGADSVLGITPVNQLSSYREPGRINLNTVVTPQVWDAVVAGPFEVEDINGNGSLDTGEDIAPDLTLTSPVLNGADDRTVAEFEPAGSVDLMEGIEVDVDSQSERNGGRPAEFCRSPWKPIKVRHVGNISPGCRRRPQSPP